MLANPEPPVVAGAILATTGAQQIAVMSCPNCTQVHRHLSAGLRTPACGGRPYIVRVDDQAATGLRAA